MPAWGKAVDHNTLIVIDEAGMAATGDLATVTRCALERGASIRLVGDDRQLAAIAAGGVLRDIHASVGAVTLTELVRFRDQAEAAAGLAIRTGDTTGLGFYIDNDRVHVGDLTTVTDQAYAAWTTDRAAGLDSVMLAPTRELATELNVRARTDRLAALEQDQPRPGVGPTAIDRRDQQREVALADGSAASTGDTIITRRNNRKLRTTATDFVKNGDRWTVTAAHTRGRNAGALDVVHLHTGRHLRLPADYVAEHVQLGYATTVHGAQGVTADTSHTVTAGAESRQQLYVALTRGRAGEPPVPQRRDGRRRALDHHPGRHPPRDRARTSSSRSWPATRPSRRPPPAPAASTSRASRSPRPPPGTWTACTPPPPTCSAPTRCARLETHADKLAPGILDSPAWPTLRGHLALIAAEGQQPEPPRSPPPCANGRSTPPPTSPPSSTGASTPPTPAPPSQGRPPGCPASPNGSAPTPPGAATCAHDRPWSTRPPPRSATRPLS